MNTLALCTFALLVGFNFFLADAMMRMREDVRATRAAAKKILARSDAILQRL
jgi:hypothetical protein